MKNKEFDKNEVMHDLLEGEELNSPYDVPGYVVSVKTAGEMIADACKHEDTHFFTFIWMDGELRYVTLEDAIKAYKLFDASIERSQPYSITIPSNNLN